MSLIEKLDADLRQAMIAKDETKLGVIRFLKSAVKYAAIEKKVQTLADADVFLVIQKQIKQRRESIDQFSKAGRKDLADAETSQVRVLETYLPKQLSGAELQTEVQAAVKETGAVSKKDFGRTMKALTEKLSGRADAKRISECLGKLLS